MLNDRSFKQMASLTDAGPRRIARRMILLSLAACAPILFSQAGGSGASGPQRAAGLADARVATPAGAFDRHHYDRFTHLDAHILHRAFAKLGRATMTTAGARPIDIRLTSVAEAFRPGYAEVTVPAIARDRATGAQADVMVEARLVMEGDPAAGGLTIKPVPLKIVPRRQWTLHNLARWDFARRLREIEAVHLGDRLRPEPAAEAAPLDETEVGPAADMLSGGSFAASARAAEMRADA